MEENRERSVGNEMKQMLSRNSTGPVTISGAFALPSLCIAQAKPRACNIKWS